jgi:Forkhead domain
MATTPAASADSNDSRYQPSLMAVDETALPWTPGCEIPHSHFPQGNPNSQNSQLYRPEPSPIFNYAAHGLPYISGYQLGYPPVNAESSCPRTYSDLDFVSSIDNIMEPYPPSAYLLEPQRPQDVIDLSSNLNSRQAMQFDDEYNPQCQQHLESEAIDVAEYATSQYEPDNRVTNTTAVQDLHSLSNEACKGACAPEESNVDKEQPYAQLIYRALMEAPGHTMVLRDIYNWFRRNTDKATDKETKGWQNSIRHNLSMNGV